MAMKPRLWSISGLAVELGIDRRMVAKRLHGVPPDGRKGGFDAWFLETALPHVRGERRPAPATGRGGPADGVPVPEGLARFGAPWTVPSGLDGLEGHLRDGMAEMAAGVLIRAAAQIPENAAWIAARCGAPMRVVYALYAHATVTFCTAFVDAEAESAGLRWRDPEGHHVFPDPPDEEFWEMLAEIAGEPVDIEAWKKYMNARFDEVDGRA